MANRKNISKKVRFEVFKRDSFKCQYCGSSAPDVVLEIDHIKPISKGGNNQITNLITSCFSCNRGKSDRKLSDNTSIIKEKAQLDILNEKREQLKLIARWKEELLNINEESVNIFNNLLYKQTKYKLSEQGKEDVKKQIQKYGLNEVLDALISSCNSYLRKDNEGYTKESVSNVLVKIGGILYLKSQSPERQKISYIKGIARNRFSNYDEKRASIMLNDYFKYFNDYDECIEYVKICNSFNQWYYGMKNFIEQYGNKKDKNYDFSEF